MNTIWLNPEVNANHFKPSYIAGFIDISGGDVLVRNGNLYVGNKIMEDNVYLENKYATINNPTFTGHMIINGDVSMNYNVDISGNLYTHGSTTSSQFINLSDYRIKQNVIPLSDTNFSIDKLNPVFYTNTLLNKPDIGFIAHEIQAELPCLVDGIKDGPDYQSVNYIGLIGILVSEIKQLKTIVLEHKYQINKFRQP
jgi:hypothetical protein